MTPLPRSYAARLALAAALPALVLAGGCSEDSEPERSPEEVLAAAKQELDDTSGVRLDLTTDELPQGVDGVLEAAGVGTHAPAFDGDLTVLVNELTVEVPVVAVDGAVYAQLPFTKDFSKVDPADYGAPDPATLMDPESGISSWLADVEGLEKGEQTRQGERVLTAYTGTLPGPAVAAVIPSADESADFDVTFSVDEDDVLGAVDVAGPFYGDAGDVDYAITLSEYGSDPDIQRP
jgi:lipoprotein LprG